MTKWILRAAMWAAVAALPVGCGSENDDVSDETPRFGAPTITLEGGAIDAPIEIGPEMSVAIAVEAPGGVESFLVAIDSPCLTEQVLSGLGLSAQMDLTAPADAAMSEALSGLGFPVGDAVKGATKLSFDLSEFIPMIALICNETSDHRFRLTVADRASQRTTATLTFHLTAVPPVSIVYAEDADLWANTASVTTENLPEGARVEYRMKGAAEWLGTTALGGGRFGIGPVWEESRNEAGLTVRTVQAATGVFADTTYELRAVSEDGVLAEAGFATAPGDAIPNGDMSGWSGKTYEGDGASWELTYPNAAGESFWDCGNNPFLENPQMGTSDPLCYENPEEPGTALLQGRMALGFVFAPGNLFVGDFVYAGMGGTVSFGKAYGWTARPRALKLRYKAQVGTIDKVGSNDPDKESFEGQQDRSQIYVAVVDWTTQHQVVSGLMAPTGMWSPASMTSVDEGPILAYGEAIFTESCGEWTECVIPLLWYADAGAKPAEGNFSLVISCATSLRGDYLTGCSTNSMCVDDFMWVY